MKRKKMGRVSDQKKKKIYINIENQIPKKGEKSFLIIHREAII